MVSRLACTLTAPCRRGVAMPVSSASVCEASRSMVAMHGLQYMVEARKKMRSLCAALRLRRISQGREDADSLGLPTKRVARSMVVPEDLLGVVGEQCHPFLRRTRAKFARLWILG